MVIIRLSSAGKQMVISLHDASFEGLPWDQASDKVLRRPVAALARFADDNPVDDVVQKLGQALFRELQRHPTVKEAVTRALGSAQSCPIFLKLDSAAPAEYPWESLFDGVRGRFLALDAQSPITRMMPGVRNERRRFAALPLRMVAVLSATDIDASGEWKSLLKAVKQSGIDLRLHVVIGQRALLRKIKKSKPTWVSCEELTSEDTVRRALNAFDPHLVHFFCHGAARPEPLLELATERGHNAHKPNVQLGANDLKNAAPLAWLATLNCCLGGSDVEGVRALAAALVILGGYPAAIGMREPITDRDANLFCQSFYTEVFTELAAAFANGAEFTAAWANPLCIARQTLRKEYANGLGPDQAAARYRKWTVPILCVDPAPLIVVPVKVAPGHPDRHVTQVLKEMDTLELALPQVKASGAGVEEIRKKVETLRKGLGSPP